MPNTVFISTSFDSGWIMEKIAAQLQENLNRLGVPSALGLEKDYQGEPIVFQTKFLYAKPFPRALVNSVFVTHIDDRLKEIEVAGLKAMANSFVCMSPEDAAFLTGLGFPPESVLGLDLPFFDRNLEPVKLCIFSKRYSDGRKNEAWLLDWAAQNPASRDGIYFSFVGSGWLPVAEKLENLGWSVEVVSLSSHLSSEYEIQLRALRSADACLYMGFDGGALGSYDAFKAGVPLFISKTSYHHAIPGVKGLFENQAQFHAILSRLAEEWRGRREFADHRSMAEYTRQLLRHWAGLALRKDPAASLYPAEVYTSAVPLRPSQLGPGPALESYRRQHQPVSVLRILGSTKRMLNRLF